MTRYLTACLPVMFVLLGMLSSVSAQEKFPDELKSRAPKTVEEVKLLESHVQSLLERIKPATVSVSGGSGVVIDNEGHVLTVAHVNQKAGRRVRLVFPDGTRAWGETLGNHHSLDAGMIKITSEGDFPFVQMAESNDVTVGQWCLAVGFPVSFSRGREPASRLGRILGKNSRTIISDCIIMGGDSGGPLFNLDGEVIGVSSRVSGSLNSNIHVPIGVYRNGWSRMVKGEDIRSNRSRTRRPNSRPNRGYLGIRGNTDSSPAVIDEIVEGSAADDIGLKVGDEVLKIDDVKIESFSNIGEKLSTKDVGDSVVVRIRRDGKEQEFKVKLKSR